MKPLTLTGSTDDVETVINNLTQQAIEQLIAGNVYVGSWGENIIREAITKALRIRLSAL